MLDLALPPDQEQLIATVRDFCAREFAPTSQADDRAGRHGPEIFAKLASIGLPGVCFPQRYGGVGLDYLSLGLVCEELEYVDTVFRTVLSVHVGLVGMGLYTWATEGQKQQWLVPMASGRKLACYGLTEPNAGSDVASMQATARRAGSGYVLNGQKVWISDADTADFMLVFAKTDPKAGSRGVTAFMLDRAASGKALRTEAIEGRLGLHAGNVGSIFMTDLEVPEANRIGDEGDGFKIAMSCLDNGRFTVAPGATGTVRASSMKGRARFTPSSRASTRWAIAKTDRSRRRFLRIDRIDRRRAHGAQAGTPRLRPPLDLLGCDRLSVDESRRPDHPRHGHPVRR